MNLLRQLSIFIFETAGIAAVIVVWVGWWVGTP